jgi:hypothetical protein
MTALINSASKLYHDFNDMPITYASIEIVLLLVLFMSLGEKIRILNTHSGVILDVVKCISKSGYKCLLHYSFGSCVILPNSHLWKQTLAMTIISVTF